MSKECNHTAIQLNRNGADQLQRYLHMLQPGNVSLIDLSANDWMEFAYAFAAHIHYFDKEQHIVTDNWQRFFLKKEEISETLETLSKTNEVPPHLALFICFLELITLSQQRLNGITQRHLDFYYKNVLHLDHKAPIADQAHIIFELAKNAVAVKVEEGAALDGGKDADGKKRTYKTKSEFIPNQAIVSDLRTIYHADLVRAVPVANSFDGFGEDFPNDDVQWWPFGKPEHDKGAASHIVHPQARLGFALASPILLLKEGKRTVTFTLHLSGGPNAPVNFVNFKSQTLNVMLSGEKAWLAATLDVPECEIKRNKVKIQVSLPESEDAVIAYNPEVLLENFTTTNPVARFVFNEEDESGYQLYQFLQKRKVTKVDIQVTVDEIQEVVVESDLGRMDGSKPFLPFGPQPAKGSNFYIGYEEALNKPWTNLNIRLQWKDTPDSLRTHYLGYRNDHTTSLGKNTYTLNTDNFDSAGLDGGLIVDGDSHFKVDIDVLQGRNWEANAIGESLVSKVGDQYVSEFNLTSGSSTPIVKVAGLAQGVYNKKVGNAKVIYDMKKHLGLEVNQDFRVIDNIVSTAGNVQAPNFSASTKQGFVRLTLQQSFLHELFPNIYAVAMAKQDQSVFEGGTWKTKSAYIPKEPYTPQVESIQISYTASVSKDIDIASSDTKSLLNDYLDESLEFFHEHPFGQSEEHRYLKDIHDFNTDTNCMMVPAYDGGMLFIGLESTLPKQQVALLVKVLEGTENPTLEAPDVYAEDEGLTWDILTDNLWQPLQPDFVISDDTDNFLRSGIVNISIPKEAHTDNTLLPSGYHWLRVSHTKPFDAVAKMVTVIAQATTAVFEDNDNDLDHLKHGLPADTISKMVNRLAQIKGISQPFSSFGGVPKESDADFYRRVSERLRHKQRAITIWDYEHLILQEFNYLYKANCLPHTKDNDFLAPGEVEVVVIPSVVDQNIYDIYQPRISKAKRNDIEAYINMLNTLHVCAVVTNPDYREILVSLCVRFYKGKDQNFYQKQLQQDIAKFLAPWAFEQTADINFGGELHESKMVHYIEKLDYVDYIKDLELQVQVEDEDGELKFRPMANISSMSPRVVLTSVKPEEHVVKVIQTEECPTPTTECSAL